MDWLEHVGVPTLDRGGLADQVDRHLDRDLLFEAHLVEVDVDRAEAARVGLDLANQHLLGAISIDDQVEQVRPPRLEEDLLELETVEDDGSRGRVVAVDDSGQLALAVETARTLADERAG